MPERSDLYDVIVVGSGPAGAHAALALVESGVRVALIDIGKVPARSREHEPASDFLTIRKNDPEQARWFLGDDYSGIGVRDRRNGFSWLLQGRCSYVVDGATEELPLKAEGAIIHESVSRGGLGAAWGGASTFYDPQELDAIGLAPKEMLEHYVQVAKRVGISGPAVVPSVQPAVPLDLHSAQLWKRYQDREGAFDRLGVELRRAHLALLTEDLGDRKKFEPTDMHHYLDPGRSLYRPQYTIESLEHQSGFHIHSGRVVERFAETGDGVEVFTRRLGSGESGGVFRGRRLILAAGAIGSPRIALKSLGRGDECLPILAKEHELLGCLNLRALGCPGSSRRIGLGQLILACQNPESSSLGGYAQLYGHRSFLLFRLLSKIPLATPETLRLLSMITPSMIVADLRHAALPSMAGEIRSGAGGLELSYPPPRRTPERRRAVKQMRKALRMLGLQVVATQKPTTGSATHYGGSLPMGGSQAFLGTDSGGRLHPTRRVHVADSSVFRCLPAGSPTLTIMANARRTALIVKDSLRECIVVGAGTVA